MQEAEMNSSGSFLLFSSHYMLGLSLSRGISKESGEKEGEREISIPFMAKKITYNMNTRVHGNVTAVP